MANAYIPPGVSADEIVSPSFNPQLSDETTVGIVGPAEGFQTYDETVLLQDNDDVTLSTNYADVNTITVFDASDVTADPYTEGTSEDYTIDSSLLPTDGTVKVRRAMQTTIEAGETVTTYHENAASPTQNDVSTQSVLLTGVASTTLADLVALTQAGTLSVQRQ